MPPPTCGSSGAGVEVELESARGRHSPTSGSPQPMVRLCSPGKRSSAPRAFVSILPLTPERHASGHVPLSDSTPLSMKTSDARATNGVSDTGSKSNDAINTGTTSKSNGASNAGSKLEPHVAGPAESRLPTNGWCQHSEFTPPLRSSTYLKDLAKSLSSSGQIGTLFSSHIFELNDPHFAGATACLLQQGLVVPPRTAKFVLSLYFMVPPPKPDKLATAYHFHFASSESVEEVQGGPGKLLRELWRGDAALALSRCKWCCRFNAGPRVISAAFRMIVGSDMSPMLVGKQMHQSLNRATLRHAHAAAAKIPMPEAGPSTYEHVEIATDFAASPTAKQLFKYAWSNMTSCSGDLSLVLEGRTDEELPEAHVAAFLLSGLTHSDLEPQPEGWPTEASEVPGEMHGSFFSGRLPTDVGSWQSTRALLQAPSDVRESPQADRNWRGWLW